MHFFFFLISVALWVYIGFAMGVHVHSMKRWKHNKKRFLFTTTSASLIGGLLAELSHGSPDNGISFINLLVAAFAAFFSIYLSFPKYAELFIADLKYWHSIFRSQLRAQIEALKDK